MNDYNERSIWLRMRALLSLNDPRWGNPVLLNYSILHEGPLGVLDGSLKDKGLFGSDMYKQLRNADPLPGIDCQPNDGTSHSPTEAAPISPSSGLS